MRIDMYSDPESPVPVPMMLFILGDRFEESYSRLFGGKSRNSTNSSYWYCNSKKSVEFKTNIIFSSNA